MQNMAHFGGSDKLSPQFSTGNVLAPALRQAARQADNAARCLTFAALILDEAGLEFWDGSVELVERVHDLASQLAVIASETAARECAAGIGRDR